jgi:hypothetical protein
VSGHIGQPILLDLEGGILVWVLEVRGLELGDLEAQKVNLASPGPSVTPERAERGVDVSNAALGGLERAEVDASERVERCPLDSRREQ